ncbi:MAG: hypothetical protein J6K20_12935 [Thermoguttaceae bacterium]|nr:hypothetical protein [Thermoguttaceae bacterium]
MSVAQDKDGGENWATVDGETNASAVKFREKKNGASGDGDFRNATRFGIMAASERSRTAVGGEIRRFCH